MAVGTVTKYNGMEAVLFDTADRQWNDATAGNIMWCLATSAYTPAAAHSTTTNIGAAIINSGDGVPINATGLLLDDTTTAGTTYYDSDDANWGSPKTITAKYLIAVQPVAAATFSTTTSKLLFYVDLDTTSGSSSIAVTAAAFSVIGPTNGWFKTT